MNYEQKAIFEKKLAEMKNLEKEVLYFFAQKYDPEERKKLEDWIRERNPVEKFMDYHFENEIHESYYIKAKKEAYEVASKKCNPASEMFEEILDDEIEKAIDRNMDECMGKIKEAEAKTWDEARRKQAEFIQKEVEENFADHPELPEDISWIYTMCTDMEDLILALDFHHIEIVNGEFDIPEDALDEEEYRNQFVKVFIQHDKVIGDTTYVYFEEIPNSKDLIKEYGS